MNALNDSRQPWSTGVCQSLFQGLGPVQDSRLSGDGWSQNAKHVQSDPVQMYLSWKQLDYLSWTEDIRFIYESKTDTAWYQVQGKCVWQMHTNRTQASHQLQPHIFLEFSALCPTFMLDLVNRCQLCLLLSSHCSRRMLFFFLSQEIKTKNVVPVELFGKNGRRLLGDNSNLAHVSFKLWVFDLFILHCSSLFFSVPSLTRDKDDKHWALLFPKYIKAKQRSQSICGYGFEGHYWCKWENKFTQLHSLKPFSSIKKTLFASWCLKREVCLPWFESTHVAPLQQSHSH